MASNGLWWLLRILVVQFFNHAIHVSVSDPLSFLYRGGGILMVSLALFLGHKKLKSSYSQCLPQGNTPETGACRGGGFGWITGMGLFPKKVKPIARL